MILTWLRIEEAAMVDFFLTKILFSSPNKMKFKKELTFRIFLVSLDFPTGGEKDI